MTDLAFADITIPALPQKPRSVALTAVLDKGMGTERVRDMIEVSGDFIDVVKFGWATARVQPEAVIRRKVSMLKEAGVRPCTGGTFSEVALAQKKLDVFLQRARELGFEMVEISNGVNPMSDKEKLGAIERARAAGFVVWSEVGKKDPEDDAHLTIEQRLTAIDAELAAGSERVILESRESGTVGVFDHQGRPVEEMIDRIAERFGVERLLFEAPRKEQQVWMIQRFGNAVNLANIPPEDAISLATLRMGLRADTFRDFQLRGPRVFFGLGVNGAVRARARGGVIVLIDALRASATIVTALACGMSSVKPVATIEECQGDVTAGERGGRKLPHLDHANSPTELLRESYAGRQLVLTTSNGTECLLAAAGEKSTVFVGTTLNARAVAAESVRVAQANDVPITLLMAGRNNQPSIEDELAAGEIFKAMGNSVRLVGPTPHTSDAREADFFNGDSGRNLASLGYAEDVLFCSKLDEFDVVPVLEGGVLKPLGRRP